MLRDTVYCLKVKREGIPYLSTVREDMHDAEYNSTRS
jgi:hypothetical protein